MTARSEKFELGKMQPQATEVEAMVLGVSMLQKGNLDVIMALLKPNHFYLETHHRIFKAIETLYKEKSPVDMLTVVQKLKFTGDLDAVGGAYFVSQLTNKVGGGGDIEFHCRIILQHFMSRELIRIGNNLVREGYDDSIDVFDKIDTLNKGVLSMASIINSKAADKFTDLVKDAIHESLNAKTTQIEPELQFPFYALNKITGGAAKGAFIVVGARPGMGKTSLVLQIAKYVADSGSPVVVFSLEEPKRGFVNKILSAITNISAGKIKRGQLTEMEAEKLSEAQKKVNDNLIIYDTPGMCPREISAVMRKHCVEDGAKMCVIDYIQMVKADESKKSREEEVSSITRAFKNMAKEFNIPVIACASLSREVERREDKRPMLHDLRESGSIESDADMVIFLYRPEYYNIFTDGKGGDVSGLCELIISKHRGGDVGFIKLRFISHLTKFEDWKKEEDVFIPTSFHISSSDAKDNEDPPF